MARKKEAVAGKKAAEKTALTFVERHWGKICAGIGVILGTAAVTVIQALCR